MEKERLPGEGNQVADRSRRRRARFVDRRHRLASPGYVARLPGFAGRVLPAATIVVGAIGSSVLRATEVVAENPAPAGRGSAALLGDPIRGIGVGAGVLFSGRTRLAGKPRESGEKNIEFASSSINARPRQRGFPFGV